MTLGSPVRAACLTLAVLPAAGVALGQQNLALNQPFTCSGDILSGWTGLVDGVRDSDSGPGCFATSNDPRFPKYLVIDLQIPCMVSRVAVHSSANGNTREVTIAVSADGESYEVLRDYIFPDATAMTLNHNFTAQPRRAQFVRIGLLNTWGGGLGGDNCIFLREVEVYGVPTGGTPVITFPPVSLGEALVRSRELRLLRRYCLETSRECRMIVMGDSFGGETEGFWPRLLLDRLQTVRAAGTQTELTVYCAQGLGPGDASTILLDDAVGESPDLVLLTFGTDLAEWDQQQFHADLGRLAQELLDQTAAIVILVTPPPAKEVAGGAENGAPAIRRRAAWEFEQVARLYGLPMLRTEAALRAAGAPMDQLLDEGGGLLAAGHQVVAARLLELLTQP